MNFSEFLCLQESKLMQLPQEVERQMAEMLPLIKKEINSSGTKNVGIISFTNPYSKKSQDVNLVIADEDEFHRGAEVARYDPATNTVTMIRTWLKSEVDDPEILQTIGHEFVHAVDPKSYLYMHQAKAGICTKQISTREYQVMLVANEQGDGGKKVMATLANSLQGTNPLRKLVMVIAKRNSSKYTIIKISQYGGVADDNYFVDKGEVDAWSQMVRREYMTRWLPHFEKENNFDLLDIIIKDLDDWLRNDYRSNLMFGRPRFNSYLRRIDKEMQGKPNLIRQLRERMYHLSQELKQMRTVHSSKVA
jgi:hypothetical protein